MTLTQINSYIKIMPAWSIFVIFGVLIVFLLKIYFWFYFKNLYQLTPFTSLQSAMEKLFLNKVIGITFLLVSMTTFFFLSNKFTIMIPKMFLLLIWAIQLIYTVSSFTLFDHIISVKYTPHLLKEKDYFCFCGEVRKEDGKYVLDSSFHLDLIEL